MFKRSTYGIYLTGSGADRRTARNGQRCVLLFYHTSVCLSGAVVCRPGVGVCVLSVCSLLSVCASPPPRLLLARDARGRQGRRARAMVRVRTHCRCRWARAPGALLSRLASAEVGATGELGTVSKAVTLFNKFGKRLHFAVSQRRNQPGPSSHPRGTIPGLNRGPAGWPLRTCTCVPCCRRSLAACFLFQNRLQLSGSLV